MSNIIERAFTYAKAGVVAALTVATAAFGIVPAAHAFTSGPAGVIGETINSKNLVEPARFRGGRGFRSRGFRGRGFRGRGFRGRGFTSRGFRGRGFVGRGFRGRGFVGRGFVGKGFVGHKSVGVHHSSLAKGSIAWNAACAKKYKSFNPKTGKYLTFSGKYRTCRV